MYLQELEIAHDLSSEIIYEISKVNQFPDYLITGYIDELEEFHFASDLQISRCKVTFREAMLQKGRTCIFLGALSYLSNYHDKCKLLLLNKEVNKKIRKEIYQEVLSQEHFKKISRIKMWWGCLQVGVRERAYYITSRTCHLIISQNRNYPCKSNLQCMIS